LALARNGRWLATAGDNVIKLWALPAATFTRTFASVRFSKWVSSVAFSSDSRLIAAAGEDALLLASEHWVRVWNVETGLLAQTLLGHTDSINCVAFGPDGTWLASGSRDETVRLFDVASGATIRTLDVGGAVEALAISGDGRFLACAATRFGDWTVKVYQVASGALDQTLRGHEGGVLGVAFSPDGQQIASASVDRTVRLWNRSLGSLVRMFVGHDGVVNSVAFRPDGLQLATGSRDGTVKLWEVESGRVLGTLAGPGGSADVLAIDFESSGRWLAVGAIDILGGGGSALLWDLTTSQVLTCLADLKTASTTKSFSVYTAPSALGGLVTHTATCGTPLPQGAVCTCNCVFGTGTGSRGGGGGGGGGTICTCNTVCTCVPVCQAHRLLHQDATVRSMAEELVLHMGVSEIEYIRWAEEGAATDELRQAVIDLRGRVEAGEAASPHRWPSPDACARLLDDDDEVVALMAAQMLQLHRCRRRVALDAGTARVVSARLARAPDMHWRLHRG
jgi:WD40 repeat protein